MAILCDIAIIGAGPGGYVAAIRAAQKGASVALIEREYVGGVCLNWGCIPTKALLAAAERLAQVRHADQFGIKVGEVSFEVGAVFAHKENTVKKLRQGVEALIKGNNIQLVRGSASLVSATQVRVEGLGSSIADVQAAKGIVIATGSSEARPPVPGFDLPGVIGTNQALQLQTLPRSIAIVGGGAVGVEFATVFHHFGVQTTVIEMLDHLLPLEDTEVARRLEQSFKKQGIGVRVGTPVKQVAADDGGLTLTLGQNGEESLAAETVMIAVGRTPNVKDLGLEKVGVAIERGAIVVDEQMRTSVPGVYAIGDVTRKFPLAHVASAQGEVAVDTILGEEARMDYSAVPAVTFCMPQVASVGLSEDAAKKAGQPYKVGKFNFAASGRALASNETEGFVKIVADQKWGRILGVHVIHERASDLIEEGVVAIKLESAIEDLVAAIHPHPTLSEAIFEAALDADGHAIHQLRRRA